MIDSAIRRRPGGATDLVKLYQLPLEARLRALVRDPHLARDLAQDTFAAAFADLPRLADVRRFSAWLMVIAWRTYRGWLRSASGRLTRRTACTDPEAMDRLSPGAADPTAESAERTALWRAVDQVQEPYRRTLLQRFRDDMTVPEIAQVQGIGLSLAKFRLRRATQLLRAVMDPASRPPG